MRISDIVKRERPRERLMSLGADALSEAELLAIFLRTGLPGKSVVDFAHELLLRFDGLAGLLAAPRAELLKEKGLGLAKWAQLHAATELMRRVLDPKETEPISSTKRCAEYLRAKLGTQPHEVFACLFLNRQNRIIAYEELFRGTIDGATVHLRDVVRRSIARNAAALIVAHNHPSGLAEPSPSDLVVTRRLKQALALIDVHLLDHFIIGDKSEVSLAERGIL